MTDTVISEISERLAVIRLNRPHRLNAINRALLADLALALESAQSNPVVDVIVLTGEGRAFCAGDDLKEFDDQVGDRAATTAYVESIQDITRLIMQRPKPVVGAINGWAAGGGLEWVANCDIAVMGETCRCFFPELSLGVFVTGGVTSLLPAAIGLQRAKELIMLGEKFDAAAALHMGLVARVVPDDQVVATAMDVARRLAALPQPMLRRTKQVLNEGYTNTLDRAMQIETDATVDGFLDPATAGRVDGVLRG
ncbi:MAG: enoyl-CoA hydratase/isomerase family protein [Acidimicrobiia bacterium]